MHNRLTSPRMLWAVALSLGAFSVLAETHAQDATARVEEVDPFGGRDTDGDGRLTLQEVLAKRPAERHPKLKRDFSVVDWNGDNKFSADEYRAMPGVSPADERTGVPDPVRRQAEERLAVLKEKWNDWDPSGNGSLSEQEFQNAGLNEFIPGLTEAAFPLWNRDEQGELMPEEAAEVVEIAFGLRGFGGLPLRPESGCVFNSMGFRYQDADGDGQIGPEDMQLRRKLEPEQAAAEIAKYDRDQNGKLSPAEAWPISRVDILAQFLAADADQDGLISTDELLASAPSYQKRIAGFVWPGFDADGDGRLNFTEYRLCPLANFDESWHGAYHQLQDGDHDGVLAFAEFTWGRELDGCAIRALLFERLDASGDQRLDLTEFEYRVNLAKIPPQVAFTFRDKNRDGLLQLDEVQAGQPDDKLPQLARDFQIVDWNGDERLSLDEYLVLPGFVPTAQRGVVPDPVLKLAEEHHAAIKNEWNAWDADGDDALSATEFQAAGLRSLIPGLNESEFSAWDLDGDGRLEQTEAAGAIDAAFGIYRLDRLPLRRPNGVVFNWMGFRYQDADDDGFIGVEDQQLRRKIEAEQAAEQIAKHDQDQDGRLSAVEAWPTTCVDTFGRYLHTDTDLDGLISPSELLTAAPDYQKTVAKHTFPGFDSDGDGKLNLTEYRLCPLANFHEAWHETRRDANADGMLSLEEFSWPQEIESRGMVAFVFDRLDVSGDERLDLDEFPFATSYRDPQRDFQTADTNGDGMLTLKEFTNGQPDDATSQERDFRVFDANADQMLSYQEYLSIPSRTSPAQRISAKDPIVALADALIAELTQTFATADENDDHRLDSDEFRNGRMTRDVPGLELSRFRDWDRNSNGGVTSGEIQTVIRAAYGVERLDGQPYREPSGVIFNGMLYGHADENDDDRISQAEYLERGYGGKNAAERFQGADLNHDELLTFAEWTQAPHWRIDPIAEFLKFDADFSGRLSHEEVMAGTPEWQHIVTERYLPSFDDDDDQQLSLTEYRRVPMANLLASWHNKRSDRDGDGHLSFSEFHDNNGIELASLAREYFDRYDRDDDGKLSQQEFDFRINPNKTSPEIAFTYYDADGDRFLTLDELLTDLKGRKDSGAQVAIGRLEELFLAADADANKKLSLAEYRQGREQASGNGRRGDANNLSTEVARNGEPQESNTRLWVLIAVNVLLVGGVAWYALFR